MEKLTKEELMIVKMILTTEKRIEEKELEEMEQKKEKNVFQLSAIAYKKDYVLKLERIIEKIKGE